MARLDPKDPQFQQRVLAGVASAALHAVLFFVAILSGDRHDGIHSGDTSATRLVMIEAPEADERDGLELPPLEPSQATTVEVAEPLVAQIDLPATPAVEMPPAPADVSAPPVLIEAPSDIALPELPPSPATQPIPQLELNALSQRLAELAGVAVEPTNAEVAWEQDGKQYNAMLVFERANDGTAFDRVVAQVSASERGKKFTTRLFLKRLPFSQFTHMVDRWDPMVQFHDDEIEGRVHSNTPFNLMYDSRTAPKFMGKVTTAARTFHTDSKGRRRDSDIFMAGIQTRAARIPLPDELQPFEWAPLDDNARIHEFGEDTSVQFFADGSFTWHGLASQTKGYVNDAPDTPLYLLAGAGVTLHVRGTVAGKVLVYSPHRIVVESHLLYAHDPRAEADSPDYLGLVCDKIIAVAPPSVTGPGDLEINAAIFAGRRFVVTNINHRRTGTLRIYGSLSAGSVSASEPRYATRLEYDRRFERRRPPGFPSTNQFEVDDWDGKWTEVSEVHTEDAS